MVSPSSALLRYHPVSRHYRERFGCKVYKVSVAVAQSCPNRTALPGSGMAVCVFCDEWGSAAYEDTVAMPLGEQIRRNSIRIRERYRAERLLIYFQAYTTTFGHAAQLERWIDEALAAPDVAGIVIGTRPDCLPGPALRLLERYARSTYVSVELGLQTLDDQQLAFLSRGHDAARSREALQRLAGLEGVNVCAHLMFGLPGETDAHLAATARELSQRGVDGVKLHNLHVLRGTPLAQSYGRGEFQPVDLPAYAHKVRTFLEHLDAGVAVHRLNAVASRWEDVVAPDWAREKMRPTQYILDELARHDTWQGRLVGAPEPEAAPIGAAGASTGTGDETVAAPGVRRRSTRKPSSGKGESTEAVWA